MRKYQVVTGDNQYELSVLVQSLMDQGWTPQGGVAMCFLPNRSCYTFAQAMVLQQ